MNNDTDGDDDDNKNKKKIYQSDRVQVIMNTVLKDISPY